MKMSLGFTTVLVLKHLDARCLSSYSVFLVAVDIMRFVTDVGVWGCKTKQVSAFIGSKIRATLASCPILTYE